MINQSQMIMVLNDNLKGRLPSRRVALSEKKLNKYFPASYSSEDKLGEERCYYLLPPEKEKKKKSPCDGCPYGRVSPCIGYCLREIQQNRNEGIK